MKKYQGGYIGSLLGLVFMIGALVVGVYLTQHRQLISQKAAGFLATIPPTRLPSPTPTTIPSCPPILLSPANNDVLITTPSLSWSGCTRAVRYQLKVDGGIAPGTIHWMSAPLINRYFTMSGFSFDRGASYAWKVRGCYNTTCSSFSSWTAVRTFWWQIRSTPTPTPRPPTPTPASTPTPPTYPRATTCSSVTVTGAVYGGIVNGKPLYYLSSRGSATLTANTIPPNGWVHWKIASFSNLLPNGGTFSANYRPIVIYTAPSNTSGSDQGVEIRGDISEYPDPWIYCPSFTFAIHTE